METYSIEFSITGLDKSTYDKIMSTIKNLKNGKVVFTNPKEPEAVHGNEAEKEVCEPKYCDKCGDTTEHDRYGCMNCKDD